jgi:hypothetical protein
MACRIPGTSFGLALVLLGACHSPAKSSTGPPDAASSPPALGDDLPTVAEREPNDAPEQAQPLVGPVRVRGDLHPVQPASPPDEDWYEVRPGATPADLAAELGDFSGGRMVLEIYDHAHNRLLAATSGGPSRPVVVPNLRLKESLLLRVSAAKGATGSYTLSLRLNPADPDSEVEPNDRAVDATPLPLGHGMHGTLSSPMDRDWYRIELTPDAGLPAVAASPMEAGPATNGMTIGGIEGAFNILRVNLSGVADTRMRLEISDQAQRPIYQVQSKKPGDGVRLRDLALPADCQAIFLTVGGVAGTAATESPAAPYRIDAQVEAAPLGLELEPNDAFAQATPITEWRIGYLFPAGDVDLYRLTAAAPSILRAEVSGLEGVATELSLVDPPSAPGQRERLLARVNEGGTKEPEILAGVALPVGDHFVRIQAAAHQVGQHWVRDQENADSTYRVTVKLIPDDGTFEREPNDRPSQATEIHIGQSLRGYAYPRRDVDYYRLDLSSQPVALGLVLHLSGVAKIPLALSLYGSSSDGDRPGPLINTSDHQDTGSAEEIRAKLEPGVYLISVRPHPRDRSLSTPGGDSDNAYTLSVQGG